MLVPIDPLHMSDIAIEQACHAWTAGGSMGLGYWLGRYKERHGSKGFTVAEYAMLVKIVRDELGDQPPAVGSEREGVKCSNATSTEHKSGR